MPTAEERERARKGIAARRDAVKELIARHQEEFDKLHGDNRVALGLTRSNSGVSEEKLRAKIARQTEQLKKLEEQLRQAEADSELHVSYSR